MSASEAAVRRLFSTFDGLLISQVLTIYYFAKVSDRSVEAEIYRRENVARGAGSGRGAGYTCKIFFNGKALLPGKNHQNCVGLKIYQKYNFYTRKFCPNSVIKNVQNLRNNFALFCAQNIKFPRFARYQIALRCFVSKAHP